MKRFAPALLALLLLAAPAVWAKTIRVKFPPGRTTVILKGKTTGGPSESGGMDPVVYRLRARAGQQMTLHLTSAKKNAIFAVLAPRGGEMPESAIGVKDWSGTLPTPGDYEIMVYPDDEQTDTTYTLEVTIR
jgi:hypothetical protein